MEARIKQNKIVRNFSAGGLVMTLALLLFIYRSYKQKQKSNFEKEILLKEIHHRVKNNLQIISSMLSLQGNYLSDQKIKDAVNESQGRVKSMALIHQMLYQHDKFSSLDIKEYIGQLVDSISASFDPGKKKISTILEIEQIFIDIDTAIPLGLIVNELLTNAYKYAFPDEKKGSVTISLRKENDEKFNLVIKDNGIGLPEKNQIVKQSKSLGLNMVNILTRQIKGDLQITVSEGTQFSIHFAEVIRPQKNIH
jgi:two-component sensor histidine kinase